VYISFLFFVHLAAMEWSFSVRAGYFLLLGKGSTHIPRLLVIYKEQDGTGGAG